MFGSVLLSDARDIGSARLQTQGGRRRGRGGNTTKTLITVYERKQIVLTII